MGTMSLSKEMWESFVLAVAPEAETRPEHFVDLQQATMALIGKFEQALEGVKDEVMVRDQNERDLFMGMFVIMLVDYYLSDAKLPATTVAALKETLMRRFEGRES